ncbi:MurR/RpiR family transcriptional regulator [Vagococcus humatus]|uniref:MurR/RpiR family transcriptional regulator n=1 Tax=Vagococcus humatus TaxID=1889241 RepID=UPI001FB4A15B|nr:MurR/RpiR family transcriptional regulator [Vagococcus humatus]
MQAQGLTVIRKNYSQLSKTNKKIADYILNNPKAMISQSALEIGESSHTSSASVTRFAKKLGYSGLEELKFAIAVSERKVTEDIDTIVSSDDSLEQLCGKVSHIVTSTMSDLWQTVDKQALNRSIALLNQAEKVYLLGMGASSLTTYDLYHKLNRAGKMTFFNVDPHMNLEFLVHAKPTDVILAFSYSGLTAEVLSGCQIGIENQVPVILVTSNIEESILNLCTERLLIPNTEHLIRIGAISSVTASMAIANVLYLGFVQLQDETFIEDNLVQTRQNLKKFKESKRKDKYVR